MQYNTKTDKEFAQQVQGTGLFTVKGDPSKNDLTFDFKNKQNNFNGTFETINVSFDLEGVNQQSLVNATLRGSSDSTINVGTGTQNVKGVHMKAPISFLVISTLTMLT